MSRFFSAIFAVLLSSVPALATTIVSVSLEKLFEEADLVAEVRITSGESECHDVTVYRAKVLTALKGCDKDQIVYYGPYISYRIGSEYLVFLRDSGKHLDQLKSGAGDAGCFTLEPADTPYYEVMYAGYSSLAVEYSIEMDKPDYAVRVVGAQVILPKEMRSFPLTEKYASAQDLRWVHKDDFINYLKRLADSGSGK